jgi:hypothetical protein
MAMVTWEVLSGLERLRRIERSIGRITIFLE